MSSQGTRTECEFLVDNPLTWDKKPRVCSICKPMIQCTHKDPLSCDMRVIEIERCKNE
jgi:hypothetical protein